MKHIQKIWIVSATENEIAPLIRFLSINHFKDVTVEVIITGVGIANTVYMLTKQAAISKPDFAIQAGIAGAANENLKIGETVHVVSDQFSLFGAWNHNNFIDIFNMGFENPDQVPYSEKLLQGNSGSYFGHLQKVHGITSNTVSGNKEHIEQLKSIHSFDVESMEGAGFQFVMNLENIPSAQIRSISNYVKPRDESQWNIQLAIENLNQELISFLYTFL